MVFLFSNQYWAFLLFLLQALGFKETLITAMRIWFLLYSFLKCTFSLPLFFPQVLCFVLLSLSTLLLFKNTQQREREGKCLCFELQTKFWFVICKKKNLNQDWKTETLCWCLCVITQMVLTVVDSKLPCCHSFCLLISN